MTETHDNSNLLHTYCRESVKAIHTGTNLAGSQSSILNFNSAITYTYYKTHLPPSNIMLA